MGFANRHNKGNKFAVDTNGWTEYRNLADMLAEDGEGVIYPLQGFYINRKSKFNAAPVAMCDGYFVNLPAHLLADFENILDSDEDVATINAGAVGFKVRTYLASKYGDKVCYSIEFVDV